MYGVPADLDLTRFIGAMLQQVCIGEFQVQFQFDTEASVYVEGDWMLRGPGGNVADQNQDNSERDVYRLHQLLGKCVTQTAIDPPRSLTLRFESGHELLVFDSSEHYESFSIQPGNIIV